MWDFNYSSISEINKVLSSFSLAPTKKFGQNFLISNEGRKSLVDLMDVTEGMRVWEIGPGLGSITALLLERGACLTSFELDHGFASLLRDVAFKDEEHFTLIEGDALKTIFKRFVLPLPERIVGNLPYNVGSVMIGKLIEKSYLPPLMVFTLQKEVVSRMIAQTGDDDYSSFSLLTQLDYENTLALKLSRGSFYPEPNVDSAVVVMRRREKSQIDDSLRDIFIPLIRILFSQRRKTIKNNLQSSEYGNLGKNKVEEIIKRSFLTGNERAETLSYKEFESLSRAIKEVKEE